MINTSILLSLVSCVLVIHPSLADYRGGGHDAAVDTLAEAYQSWTRTHQEEMRRSAAMMAKEMARKLNGRSFDSIISEQTMNKIKTPLSQQSDWFNKGLIRVSARDAASAGEVSSPFFNGILPGITAEEVGAVIYDLMTREIREIANTGNPDATELLEAMLLTSIDASGLGTPAVVALVSQALGEFAAAMDPVPPYLEDKRVREADGSPVLYHEIVQDNWSNTLGSTEIVKTYYPLTRQGVINIVKKAKSENARVRASGAKHSWNHWVWGVDNIDETLDNSCYTKGENGNIDYFIAMVPYEISDNLYFIRGDIEGWRRKSQELSFVEGPLDQWVDEDGTEHVSVKVGAAAMSMFLTEWSLENGWMLPAEPMTPQFTLGGVVSTASHGSGLRHAPVADRVIALEYVDEKGEVQHVDDPHELDATAGSYGLFGILLSVTFKLDRMTYATYGPGPITVPMEQYIPRSPNPLSDELLYTLENHYYATWFIGNTIGSPYRTVQRQTWNNDGRKEDAVQLISDAEDKLTNYMTFLTTAVNELMKDAMEVAGTRDYLYRMSSLVEDQISSVLSTGGEGGKPITTTAVEAIHFARGMHVWQIRNFEVNVPIKCDKNNGPDWTTLQDAWWLTVDLLDSYETKGMYPMDSSVELRLHAGSRRIFNAVSGNECGSIAIDITSTPIVPEWLWAQFRADIAFRFQHFNDGTRMPKPRHHIGKQFPVNVTGMTSAEYFADTYGDQIDTFRQRYDEIVTSRGSNSKDSLRRFSTKFFDSVLQDCGEEGSKEICFRVPWGHGEQ